MPWFPLSSSLTLDEVSSNRISPSRHGDAVGIEGFRRQHGVLGAGRRTRKFVGRRWTNYGGEPHSIYELFSQVIPGAIPAVGHMDNPARIVVAKLNHGSS